jgi:glucose-6-phosphate isomerase
MSSLKAARERLARLNDGLGDTSLWELFAAHPDRVATLSRHLVLGDDEMLLDLSKQHLTGDVMSALVDLVAAAGVAERRDAMYRGDAVNESENRPALHVALRSTSHELGISREHAERARRELHRMCEFADSVRAGALGDVRTVVNVGIGGSELGPATLYEALCADADPAVTVRWLANVDPYEFHREVRDLDPATTLVVVCSKTFTTTETLSNARFAARWLGDHASRRLVAVTARTDAARSSGLPFADVFEFWEWVGGRYSVAGAPSLAVAVAHSGATLRRVLAGMESMDRHFGTAPLAENLPVLLGALEWWNVVVRGHGSRAVVVYSSALRRLPEHLAQLEMESNGKSVDRSGAPLTARTPITWGGVGTSVQHAFFQALHQGVDMPPTEFVGFSQVARVVADDPVARDAHDTLVSNMFAQSRALAFGSHLTGSVPDPHRSMPGNRPSTTLLVSKCSPEAIGALLALYEHATFVHGVLWDVNPFDQWGVELGKSIAKDVAASFVQGDTGALDSSSAMLVDTHRRWRTSS